MICPDCHRSFDGDSCPRCRAAKGVVKTSTILISAGETRSVYRSVDEVPDGLKRQLLRSTNGTNSATIVIADRQGRREIANAIRNIPATEHAQPPKFRPTVVHAVGALLLLAAAASVWFLFHRLS